MQLTLRKLVYAHGSGKQQVGRAAATAAAGLANAAGTPRAGSSGRASAPTTLAARGRCLHVQKGSRQASPNIACRKRPPPYQIFMPKPTNTVVRWSPHVKLFRRYDGFQEKRAAAGPLDCLPWPLGQAQAKARQFVMARSFAACWTSTFGSGGLVTNAIIEHFNC